MEITFLCAPYRANTDTEKDENIQKARKAAKRLWTQGIAVICPHSNSALFSGICEEAVFLAAYKEIIKRCDSLTVYAPLHIVSPGMMAEIETARNNHKPIYKLVGGHRIHCTDIEII